MNFDSDSIKRSLYIVSIIGSPYNCTINIAQSPSDSELIIANRNLMGFVRFEGDYFVFCDIYNTEWNDMRQNISIYAYCSGDPINKVDLDGCDEWEISENGHLVRHVETKEHDAFFVLDRDGSRVEGKSISFEYGTVKSFHSDLNWDGENFNVIKMRGDKQSTAAFEFLASNTKVEWGHSGTGEEGAKGLNFLTTSMDSGREAGGTSLINYQLINGYNVRFHIHSHPGGDKYPSGLDSPLYNSTGDIKFAQYLTGILESV